MASGSPPVNPLDSSRQPPPISTSSAQSSSFSSTSDFLHLPTDVVNAIQACKDKRNHNLDKLSQINPQDPFVAQIRDLEQELNDLKTLYTELQTAADDNTDAIKEIFLNERVGELYGKYRGIGLVEGTLDFLFTRKSNLIDFECNIQIALCEVFNQTFYEKQVCKFIEINSARIIACFESNGVVIPVSIRTTNHLDIAISSLQKDDATTHNGGKAPLLITLNVENESFGFVFKPRDAQIDEAVFSSFQVINHQNNKALPHCIIFNPKDEEDWLYIEEIGECSLWELKDRQQFKQTEFGLIWDFLEERRGMQKSIGEISLILNSQLSLKKKKQRALARLKIYEKKFHSLTFGYYKDRLENIKSQITNLQDKEESAECLQQIMLELQILCNIMQHETDSLFQQATTLDSIFFQMKIGDLLPQNFVFSRIGEDLVMIPIDLEVYGGWKIQESPFWNTSMGIPAEIRVHQTIEDIIPIIESFHQKAQKFPVRFLPLCTQSMVSYSLHGLYSSRGKLTKDIMEALQKDFEVTIKLDELQEHVLMDLLNKDVPYCTLVITEKEVDGKKVIEKELFYGLHSNKVSIGVKRD